MEKPHIICTTLLIERSPQALPLGAACIASAIKHNEHTKDICSVELMAFCQEDEDFLKHGASADEAAAYIAEGIFSKGINTPKIVCFSIFVWNRIILEKAARILRDKCVICVAGGPEVTANPKSFSNFDYLSLGEGEISVPALIHKILKGENVSESIIGKESCKNLEELSSPYLDGTLDPAEYEGALWELARGCPFKCSYCYESKGEKHVRQFPMERIEAELDLFAKKKVPQVFVLDPTYNANKDRAIKLLNLIAKKTPNTFYYFEARAEFIDAQLAKAFTKIPCALQIGLQSANEEILKLVNRPFNRKVFVKNIGILNNAGVTFGFDLIYGLPGETFKGFKEGIDFALSLYPNNLEIFCLSVLPGTDLSERADSLNLNYDKNPPYKIINTDKFSVQDIEHAGHLAKACNIFYNDGCAVPWFNIILHSLKMRAAEFFDKFYIEEKLQNIDCEKLSHIQIEKMQLDFILKMCKEKHAERFVKIMSDLIKYYGALSRKTATGKSESVQLNFPPKYLESEYIFNLDFFVKNVKIKPNTIRT